MKGRIGIRVWIDERKDRYKSKDVDERKYWYKSKD